jgi:Cu/Ag efflux protein CusF
MRKSTLVVTAFAFLMSATVAWSQMQMTTGEVRKIDEAAGKITIKHGPVKKFDMDAPMAMVYRVKDPAMLKSVKVGEKVSFDADKVDGVFTVTKIEKAK